MCLELAALSIRRILDITINFSRNVSIFLHIDFTKAYVESRCKIGSGCIIGTRVRIPKESHLTNFQNVYYPSKLVQNYNFSEKEYKESIITMVKSLKYKLCSENKDDKKL